MITVKIEGFSPVKEVTKFSVEYGCYPGQAIKAVNGGFEWYYICTVKGVRKATDLEGYLFK